MVKGRRGFTIIEMLVTIVIVSVLASVAFPMAELATKRAKEKDLRHALLEIREALDAYKKAADEGRVVHKADTSGYPSSIEILVTGVPTAQSTSGAKLYFLRRVPRDPFSRDDTLSAAATWGVRSYASSSDDPKEGNDVYDVYSLSSDIGLNGVPYRDW